MNPTTRAILDYNAGRDPVRLRLKYQALRKDPFAFFRGTAPLYFATLNMPRALQQSPRVVACGDLHLENFGSYKGDNRLVYFDLSDFDEVCIAPLSFDIVRFLSSVHVAAKYLKIGNKSAVSLVTDIVDTYATALASTKPRWVERATATGQREICRMLRHRSSEFQFAATFGERGFEFDLGDVDEFTGGGLLFLGECAELFHQRGELAVRPDPRAFGLFERGEVGRGFEFRQCGLFQRFDFIKKRHKRGEG